MAPRDVGPELDELTTAFEDFTNVFIRLPSSKKYSFTTLSVLHTLSRRASLRLSELTATEQITQSAVTQLVTRLELDGLVERRPDPSDGRAVLVELTPSGRDVVIARHRERSRGLAELLDHLTPGERRSMAGALPALRRIAELGGR